MARSPSSAWVIARNSAIHGEGLYARVPIPSGTKVIDYRGERITKAESRRREEKRRERVRQGGPGSVFIFNLNRRHDLDGSAASNLARLINHSCKPNCQSEIIRGKIWIIARRDIAAGEELGFDYGYPVAEWQNHPCRCGVPDCAGYIVAKAQRRHLRQRLRAEKRKARTAAKR